MENETADYFASTLNCSSWVLTFGKIKILNIFFEPKSLQKQIISHHPWDWTSSYQWGTPGGILGTEDVASILVLGPEQVNRSTFPVIPSFTCPEPKPMNLPNPTIAHLPSTRVRQGETLLENNHKKGHFSKKSWRTFKIRRQTWCTTELQRNPISNMLLEE